jgi:hypothetical protein
VTETTIDDLDAHLAAAGSIDRAALVPGMYLAWCVNLQLVAKAFDARHGRDILRLRYRELTPAAFFLKTAHGRLTDDLLSEQGARFAAHHYAHYRAETAPTLYGAKDDWATYDSIAPALTKAYYAFAETDHRPLQRGKHWWNTWRH